MIVVIWSRISRTVDGLPVLAAVALDVTASCDLP